VSSFTTQITYVIGNNCILEASPFIGLCIKVHCRCNLHEHDVWKCKHECWCHCNLSH